MRVLPVLDLKGGQVVRGIAGRRETYQPIASSLTPLSKPRDVAVAFRDHFALHEMYLADLDAIAGKPPALPTYAELRALGLALWVDAGIRTEGSVSPLLEIGVESIVVGLETVMDRNALMASLAAIGPERAVFSLDLKDAKPLANASEWGTNDPWAIACQAVDLGVKRLLVLDLARVGMGSGTGTEDLCRKLARTYRGLEISAGGGVRGISDLERLRDCGVHVALVASALHDGRINPAHLREICGFSRSAKD